MSKPTEASRDPFRLARRIDSWLERDALDTAFHDGQWHRHGEPIHPDDMRALVTRYLKTIFDADNLVDAEGRVQIITHAFVTDVLQALSAVALDAMVYDIETWNEVQRERELRSAEKREV